jgi:hypothetical protein
MLFPRFYKHLQEVIRRFSSIKSIKNAIQQQTPVDLNRQAQRVRKNALGKELSRKRSGLGFQSPYRRLFRKVAKIAKFSRLAALQASLGA